MALSKRNIRVIVALIILSLGGLVVLQVYLLNNAFKLKEQSFDNNIASALTSISEMLETRQTMAVIFDAASNYEYFDSTNIDINIDSYRDSIHSRLVFIKTDTQDIEVERFGNYNSFRNIITIGEDSLRITDTIRLNSLDKSKMSEINMFHNFDSSGRQYIQITAAIDDRTEFIEKVLNKMWISENIPFSERLDSTLIDSVIKVNLQEANIDMDYAFGITGQNDDSFILTNAVDRNELMKSKYKTRLFPFDYLSPAVELLLYFPGKQRFIWSQIIPMLMTIGFFISIIIICFVYIIKTIVAQKQTALLMTNFINNMTHEFRTPISTISLAAEAILRQDVIAKAAKVSQYSNMILDENRRMRHQAEKILQVAALEEGDFELKMDDVDLHIIIREAADSITLRAEQQEGKLHCSLKADKSSIKADKVHIAGVIYNLLDNACKYSPDKPEIKISTLNADGGIYIKIIDNGIGIRSDDLKRVFEKYYRVSAGNIHNVKGFGLGLSYVKMMVEAHNGTIKINSRFGEETRVEIFIPQSE